MRMRAGAVDLANGGRSRGRAAVRGRDEADGWGVPVSVPQREGRGGSNERDPPVSDPQREEGGSARGARVGRTGMGRPAGRFPGHSLHSTVFLFFLCRF